MTTEFRYNHDDSTTVDVDWLPTLGGAQSPAGVPTNYLDGGPVNWSQAVTALGPKAVWWNSGQTTAWGQKKVDETVGMINRIIDKVRPAWYLTGDNGDHTTGIGDMRNVLSGVTGINII